MEFKHTSVLLWETIENLDIKPDGIYVDGTLGGGGHSFHICEKLGKKGRLIGIDQDEDAIKPCIINGLNKESIKQLKQAAINSNASEGCNIIEVMCCTGGCIGGNAAINSQKNAVKQIDNFAANSEDIKKID